ncbi:MAG: hypothetical protein WA996_21240 [Candidatus Promineifilaceae bacterium]
MPSIILRFLFAQYQMGLRIIHSGVAGKGATKPRCIEDFLNPRLRGSNHERRAGPFGRLMSSDRYSRCFAFSRSSSMDLREIGKSSAIDNRLKVEANGSSSPPDFLLPGRK